MSSTRESHGVATVRQICACLACGALAAVIILSLGAKRAEAAGPAWTEYSGNPVFGQAVGSPAAYYPSVVYDAAQFSGRGTSSYLKMWYDNGTSMGLATSDDGTAWTNRGAVTLARNGRHALVKYFPAGFAGRNSGDNPSSGTMYYRMWYWDPNLIYTVSAMRHTESADGMAWYNDQPLQNGTVPIVSGVDPSWNRGSYGPCDILYNPGAANSGYDWVFTMYFDGTTGGAERIGLGFSSDGVTWTGYDANADGQADPVLQGSGAGWDSNYVSRATVIKNSPSSYEMWFSGGTGSMDQGIGYATSSDGMNWVKDSGNPVFHASNTGYPGYPWRSSRTYCPAVLKTGGIYRMWFAGVNSSGRYSIGYARVVPAVVWVDDSWQSQADVNAFNLSLLWGYDAFNTVQGGIDAVAVAGTVNVREGTYTPAGGRVIVNKSITVQAEPGLTVRPKINTSYAGWTNCAIQIGADNVVFQGFEVDNRAAHATGLRGYIVGDYGAARNGWVVRNCDIHNGRNAIRPVGNNVTIEYNNLHETESDLINAEYGNCYGLKVSHNWLHSHHSDLGGKPAGLTYNVSSTGGANVEVTYNYAWACRTFIDFQNNGGLSPANHVLVAHNTVDFWIGDLPDPVNTQNGEQMSLAWWSGSGNSWNGPNFEIRDNLFTRQKWYAVVDTDAYLQGQITLRKNMFWQWYLRKDWYPTYAYPNEWPGPRGAVGWDNMGPGNQFVMQDCITGDPLYLATGATPDQYYALRCGSPALDAATDGTNIGAWQGDPGPTPVDLQIDKARQGSGFVIGGEIVTYTLTITNAGRYAVDAVVTDTFPSAVVSGVSCEGCMPAGSSAVWSLPPFTGTQVLTLALTTVTDYTGVLTNCAVITPTPCAEESDPADNEACVEDYVVSPTPVTVTDLAAGPDGQGVLISWETVQEVDMLGFNVFRSATPEGERQQLNQSLIPAQSPGQLIKGYYSHRDGTAALGVVYYYWLQAVDTSGSDWHGPVRGVWGSRISLPAIQCVRDEQQY